MKCHRLSESSGVILYGYVGERDIRTFYLQGVGAESSNRHQLARDDVRRGDIGMIIISNNGIVAILTAYLYIGKPRRDNEFLLIYAFLNIDYLMIFHKGTTNFYRFIDSAELSRTITSHNNGIWRVVGLCHASQGYE